MLAALIMMVALTVTDNRPSVTVILHRAAGMAAPENSRPALIEAYRQGADGVEIDIRRTTDGHLVLYHDDWVYDPYGPGTRIEDLTLAEVARLDIGSRWGAQWKGERVPLLLDALLFCRAANLLVYLDIKTPGIEADVMQEVQAADAEDLIIFPPHLAARQPVLPWIQGWNYLDGGEEDLRRIERVLRLDPRPAYRVMADDARAFSMALRRPPRGPAPPMEQNLAARVREASGWRDDERRAELRNASPAQLKGRRGEIVAWARRHEDPRHRLDAIWALGRMGDVSVVPVLAEIAREPDAERPAEHPSGMPYFDTFRRAAVAGALVRLGGREADAELAAMARSSGMFVRPAVALALSAFGRDARILDFVSNDPANDAITVQFALSHAARHPQALDIYRDAMVHTGMARRVAVFGLAHLGDAALPTLVRDVRAGGPRQVPAAQAIYWMTTLRSAVARRELQDVSPEVRFILGAPRPWDR